MRRKVLSKKFFNRSANLVAPDLLGKFLVKDNVRYKIVETESYEGFDDKASHASRGKTPRNTPMFGRPGTIYVYFTYGMHYMLNLVCGPQDHPAAVLIRGVDGIIGPGRLTKKLNIDKKLNGLTLGRKSGLWVEEGEFVSKKQIKKTPRIGVDYSGPWSKKLLRFVLK